jgi:Tol biopolymer transport system component
MNLLKFGIAVSIMSLLAACNTTIQPNNYKPYTRILISSSRVGGLFGNASHTYVIDVNSGREISWTIPRKLGDEVEWSVKGDWIVFSTLWTQGARPGSNSEIYLMKYPEGDTIKVTDSPYDDTNPIWSPNGKKIAYESDGQIKVLDVECFQKSVKCKVKPFVLVKGRFPDWSSNGEWISYESEGQIYMISPQGGELVNLTQDFSDCWRPNWSPVNMQIIFLCNGLYILNVGSNTEPIKLSMGQWSIGEPVWSPDGLKIAFVSDREDYGLGKVIGGDGMILSNAVFLIDADGSNLQRISPYDDEDILWYAWIP